MLSGYRLMWMMVMFDLPVVERTARKAASDFRNRLLDMGFEMVQFSVYMRFITGEPQSKTYIKRIENALPRGGKVNILFFTDRQYEKIQTYYGKIRQAELKNPVQYELF